jgi:large subunit ribosomal protein L9
MMKIILREDVPSLGGKGTVVNVANGYGRNYLIPKGFAYLATPGNMNRYEEEKQFFDARSIKDKEEAQGLASRLTNISCTIAKKVGENEVLYGSVTNADIAAVLKEEGFNVDKRKIVIDEPLKKLGVYNIPIKLHLDVTADLKVWVVKE